MHVQVNFAQPIDDESAAYRWNKYVLPGSGIVPSGESWRFVLDSLPEGKYSDAQIDDYQGKPRRGFPWAAPLTMTVRARFSHAAGVLKGTAGFGFWNDPFAMTGKRLPALPRSVWFFYGSPENDLKLHRDVPGHGWKAATIDAMRLPFYALAPTAPLAVPLMNIKPLYRALWPIGQRAIGVSEALINAPMTAWHTYRLEWGKRACKFWVDDALVLESAGSVGGRLGFVMWIDNQAMAVAPWGRFAWKMLPISEPQWMEVDQLEIATL